MYVLQRPKQIKLTLSIFQTFINFVNIDNIDLVESFFFIRDTLGKFCSIISNDCDHVLWVKKEGKHLVLMMI